MYKILCAADETEASRKAIKFAATMAKAMNAELCYLYVSLITEEVLNQPTTDVSILEVVKEREHSVLADAEKVALAEGVKATCAVARGRKPSKVVEQYAEAEGYDHIIAGATGRKGIPRFVLGSTAVKIVNAAHCPVTVVR